MNEQSGVDHATVPHGSRYEPLSILPRVLAAVIWRLLDVYQVFALRLAYSAPDRAQLVRVLVGALNMCRSLVALDKLVHNVRIRA